MSGLHMQPLAASAIRLVRVLPECGSAARPRITDAVASLLNYGLIGQRNETSGVRDHLSVETRRDIRNAMPMFARTGLSSHEHPFLIEFSQPDGMHHGSANHRFPFWPPRNLTSNLVGAEKDLFQLKENELQS